MRFLFIQDSILNVTGIALDGILYAPNGTVAVNANIFINLEVELSPELETVWQTQKQMEELFGVKQATLSEHINNIISSGKLDETSIGFSDKSSGGRKSYLRKSIF